jgi:hypothetical protein
VRQLIVRVVELVALYFTVSNLNPWLDDVWPHANPLLQEGVTVFVSAAIVEVLLIPFFLRPEIHLGWKSDTNPNELLRLDISAQQLRSGAAWFNLSIKGNSGGSLFGKLLLLYIVWAKLELKIGADAAPAYMTCDFSRPIRNPKVVREAIGDNGLFVVFPSMPPRNLWIGAKVIFTATHTPAHEVYDLEMHFRRAGNKVMWLTRLIKVSSSAGTISIYT